MVYHAVTLAAQTPCRMPTPQTRELPRQAFDAVIFDLDGVITRTATLHAASWKKMFDEFLQRYGAERGQVRQPFDEADYRRYVDGKPRYEGVASFLESRGIQLPWGDLTDPPDRETVCGLGNRKNELFLKLMREQGVETYASTIDLIRELRGTGIKTAVVSSSKSTLEILESVHITELFDVKIDGVDASRLGLPGKPAPDTFLEATKRLGVPPSRAVVVEDAIAGVQAGSRGGFGCVVGVDRTGHPEALKDAGADLVVADLAEVKIN